MNEIQVQILIEIARQGSFSKAAEQLYLTPQGLTKHVNNVEKAIGFTVFSRSFRGVTLTNAGSKLIAGLERLNNEYQQLLEECRDSTERNETLNLAMIPASPLFLVEAVLPEYKKRNPDISVNLVSCEIEHIFDALRAKKIDLFLYPHIPKNKASEFQFVPVYRKCMYCLMEKTHSLARNQTISIEDLHGQNVYMPSIAWCREIAAELEENGIHIEETKSSYLKTCYERNIWLSAICAKAVPESIVQIPLDYTFDGFIGFVCRKQSSLTVQRYIDLSKKIFGDNSG